MTRQQYVDTCLPLGALALLCLAQVYPFRLRRAIAAFYFPKVSSPRAGHSLGGGFWGGFWVGCVPSHPPLAIFAGTEGEDSSAVPVQQIAAAEEEFLVPAARAHSPAGTAAPRAGEWGQRHGVLGGVATVS